MEPITGEIKEINLKWKSIHSQFILKYLEKGNIDTLSKLFTKKKIGEIYYSIFISIYFKYLVEIFYTLIFRYKKGSTEGKYDENTSFNFNDGVGKFINSESFFKYEINPIISEIIKSFTDLPKHIETEYLNRRKFLKENFSDYKAFEKGVEKKYLQDSGIKSLTEKFLINLEKETNDDGLIERVKKYYEKASKDTFSERTDSHIEKYLKENVPNPNGLIKKQDDFIINYEKCFEEADEQLILKKIEYSTIQNFLKEDLCDFEGFIAAVKDCFKNTEKYLLEESALNEKLLYSLFRQMYKFLNNFSSEFPDSLMKIIFDEYMNEIKDLIFIKGFYMNIHIKFIYEMTEIFDDNKKIKSRSFSFFCSKENCTCKNFDFCSKQFEGKPYLTGLQCDGKDNNFEKFYNFIENFGEKDFQISSIEK